MNHPSSTAAGFMRLRSSTLALITCVVLPLVFLGAAGARAQTDRPTDPAGVVHAFNAALSRGDLATALSYLDPACRKIVGPHSLNREEQKCGGGEGEFPGVQTGPIQVAEANLRTTGPETAEVDMTLSGNTLPPTPHPITLHAIFTVRNGLIIQLLDELSPQTEQELAALAPPPETPAVMPNTGVQRRVAPALLLVGALCAGALGMSVRRRARRA